MKNIKRLYIEQSVLNNKYAERIISRLEIDPIIINHYKDLNANDRQLKESIILAEQRGRYLKPCPCTPKYIGCKYYVLELVMGCGFDCSYCYLQQYQNQPGMIVYVNLEKMFEELSARLDEDPNELTRIGTGEFTDSLFLDEYTGHTNDLTEYLANNHKNYIIEYKTKSNNIANLLKSKPTGNEVISWSLNPSRISLSDENGAPAPEDRLESAKKCIQHGYYIGLHFDPIIYFKGYEDEYNDLIDKVYNYLDKDRILWISLGTLRFNSELKSIMEYRHPMSRIHFGEMIKGLDGKTRYFKDLRKEMYRAITSKIKGYDKNAFIYFCMEDREIWNDVLGLDINNSEDVHKLFCKRRKELKNNEMLR
ncbi:MAG: spore photoproduct lyase family protein [Elusimicrobiota bacterium]